ncbi:MAG: D-alanyl-D-alanine carboxypeptidase [Chloroflexi bacterium]|nr:D-alanyl-D-alanine carboxypeptidase [Chloroflexota bacterium]
MGRRGQLLLLAAASLACLGFGPPVLVEKDAGGEHFGPAETAAYLAWAQPPEPGAKAALLGDPETGQVLLAKNAHERLPMASTTKVMTALLVLEQAQLSDLVTVSSVAAFTGGQMVGFVPGEQLTVLELLYGLMLHSGNDAASALAEHVGGSAAEFVARMNVRAQELGMVDTHFVNPHGLDADGHYSSAHDLWLLTRAALQIPVFREIVATAEYSGAGRRYANLNELLGAYPGADGVKTGTTEWAGECLIASASSQGHQWVTVVLDSPDRYADTRLLLSYAHQTYRWLPVRLRGRALSQVAWQGQPCRLALEPAPDRPLPAWQAAQVRPFRRVTADPKASSLLAAVEFYVGDALLLSQPLRLVCPNEGSG